MEHLVEYSGNAVPMSDDNADLLSHEFCVETHFADAMPASHWHDHVELNYLWSGQLTYLTGGRTFELAAGALCVFWAATPHQVVAVDEGQRLSCAYLPLPVFLSLPLEADFRRGILHGDVFATPVPEDGDRQLFERWTREWQAQPSPQRQILEEEVQLRIRRLSWSRPVMLASPDKIDAPPVDNRSSGRRAVAQAEKMTRFIHDHLGAPLTVKDVVDASGLHPTNASSAFRRVLGMTIGEYVRRHRLRHAMRLLVDTDMDIAEISYECGYSSVTRLYDSFQSRLGKTPRRYRQDFRN